MNFPEHLETWKLIKEWRHASWKQKLNPKEFTRWPRSLRTTQRLSWNEVANWYTTFLWSFETGLTKPAGKAEASQKLCDSSTLCRIREFAILVERKLDMKWGGLRIMMLVSRQVSKKVRMWAQSMTIYRTIRKWKIGFDIYYRWTTTKIRGEKKLLILLAHHQKVGWTTKYQGPSKEVYRLSATIQKNGCSIHVWIDLKMDGYLTSSILWVLKGYRIPEWYPQTFGTGLKTNVLLDSWNEITEWKLPTDTTALRLLYLSTYTCQENLQMLRELFLGHIYYTRSLHKVSHPFILIAALAANIIVHLWKCFFSWIVSRSLKIAADGNWNALRIGQFVKHWNMSCHG